jgi:diadenosine tetraphosphate (Ap4A) HIT family hydrolase
VMVKAMTAAVTFHPHLHHIPKKKIRSDWMTVWLIESRMIELNSDEKH